MKIKYILLLLVTFTFGLIGCSNGDEPAPEVIQEGSDLVLDNDSVLLIVGSDKSPAVQVNIKEGAEGYKAFSLNTDIAEVEVSGNTIAIRGINPGVTDVIVMDKNNSIKKINVAYIYDKIATEKALIQLEHFVGKRAEEEIFFLTGNGGYTVAVKDDGVIEALVKENSVVIKNVAEDGKSSVVITDSQGKMLEIPVEVTSTTIPYSKVELDNIMKSEYYTFIWNNENIYASDVINTEENGNTLIGSTYYDDYLYLKILFPGDKSVGEKKGAKLDVKSWGGVEKVDLTYFEIIKNDGKKLWAVYSYVDREKGIGKAGYMISSTD